MQCSLVGSLVSSVCQVRRTKPKLRQLHFKVLCEILEVEMPYKVWQAKKKAWTKANRDRTLTGCWSVTLLKCDS